ncbi:MAG: transcription-repair coupling factor [Cetobacterium sp.]
MFRDEVPFFLSKERGKVIYLASSNKNIDIYFYMLQEKGIKNIVKVDDLLDDESFYRINYELIDTIKNKKEYIILISLEGILKNYIFDGERLCLKLGKVISQKDLIEKLESSGYTRNYLVEKRMEYSIRGDIFDVFPPSGENPVRIEFFGDEIDRISYFSIYTQKTVEKISEVYMYIDKNNENRISFMNIVEKIHKKDLKLFIENPELLRYRLEENVLRDREKEKEIRDFFIDVEDKFTPLEVIKSDNKKFSRKKDFTKDGIKYNEFSQIRENDYIIHENYGVGIYLGIEIIDNKDYLMIKYAGEDKLYVPIDGINRIERYICDPGNIPEIYNLGRRGFKKRREKLEEEMLQFAKDIVAIQAKRAMNIGYSFSPDTVWQDEFEEKFQYTETRDQRRAIEDVKRDMESSKVMDRIVCGDVGYGKTEVAVRATFKAIMDGKQVLLIAPTTVLAQQHFERFQERFQEYPITMDILSRLKSDKEQNETIKKLQSGSLDVVIGTHRALSSDVKFNNLGLIIVDEEQKFGVKAKESLKKIRNSVDMLTLTATPIPRTLNLALLGIRDISVIETAPEGRIPVETMIMDNNKKEIRDAIMREIAREGQVFYIYNVVKSMEKKLEELRKIVPKFINIEYIHGKMTPKEIKARLRAFEDGEIDILLSTTIIENGIDIENANTIIIEGMDKLGLSQVYQLRGRVGRGKRKGYCYLVKDADKDFGKKAAQREESLKNLEPTGGGFQLSLEDMRIRGAGEILGDKQHGALETFGYNLYMKLLKEEIGKVKGEEKSENIVKIDLDEEAFIPDSYISSNEKLVIYRRALDIDNLDELLLLERELRDRFGKEPREVKNLFRFLKIKILAKIANVVEIKSTEDGYFISFNEVLVNFEKLHKLISDGKARYSQREKGLYYKGEMVEFLEWYLGGENDRVL